MVQTPQQRKANEKFAKREEKKKGKSENVIKTGEKRKSPISTGWLVVLAFAVCGGLAFEIFRLFFDRFFTAD